MDKASLLSELLSQIWFRFALVALFGFLTGLEFREYILLRSKERPEIPAISLGTSRTFTFIAILGYLLFILDPDYRLYMAGMAGLLLFLGLFYYQKLKTGQTGLLQPLIALIVYTYGAIISLQPPWFLILVFVTLVFTLSTWKKTHRFVENIDPREMPTLAKFLLLSGVILPLLPNTTVSPYLPVTPFKIWLAVVVISSISYIGYILKKYLLKRQGYLITGLLGGLYSSTATTVVLARKTRGLAQADPSLNAGIISATGMMYLRLLILVAIMNSALLLPAAAPLLILGLLSIGIAILADRKAGNAPDTPPELGHSNPLELGIALLFAVLFVLMIVITQQVINHFGRTGLDLLSLVVGFTDIDPFVLSVLSGHYKSMTDQQLVGAIVVAAGSNNLLKAVYAFTLGERKNIRSVSLFLFLLGLITIAYGLALPRLS
ncbi:Glutamate synthase [NADPH] large chain [hydrothermal vent metagenome]|uniref:Glutamate synthase [NADPH] large chain n=1 Tax=hydrothermal vent metagenome TaxID=652676 RepID=A0A3B1B8G4_9ZZZZ